MWRKEERTEKGKRKEEKEKETGNDNLEKLKSERKGGNRSWGKKRREIQEKRGKKENGEEMSKQERKQE